jgi:metallophosphoesterase (TIGR00282 family)
MSHINLLIFGDIVGKPGRKAVKGVIEKLKKKFEPDLIMANAENLAHGYGVTEKTLEEMTAAGVQFFTSGNHVFQNPTNLENNFQKFDLVRPANYIDKMPGVGLKMIEIKNRKIAVVNLLGRVFMPDMLESPFRAFDRIYKKIKRAKADIIIVDFHAEATSEKRCLGAYLDGRASLVFGTHTHVQTADEQILPKGTGYISDLGMTGLKYSSLGMDFENIIQNFLDDTTLPKQIPETGACLASGIFAKINPVDGKTEEIKRFNEEITV